MTIPGGTEGRGGTGHRLGAGLRSMGRALASAGHSQGARLVEAWPVEIPLEHAACTRAQTNGQPASRQQSAASDGDGDGCHKLLDCHMSNHLALICLMSVDLKRHGFLAFEPLNFIINVRSSTDH